MFTKMPAQTLLEINSDELFEKHTIAEIKSVEIQIQNEIEKKREELRTMVGEKCRDLLKAADTITEMKDTSKKIILVINETKQLCEALQEKRLTGFRQPSTQASTKWSNNTEEISKVIEIKILLTLPEQIWTAIDNKDYLLATQLFLFATHLHLGLEVYSSSQSISNKYPVLNKQWAVISNCKKIIVDRVCKELKVINICPQKATECLCSLFLLEVISYEKLLNQFLDLRMSSLNDLLKSEELSRKKLRQSVEIIQQTLVLVFICFFDKPGKKCSILEELDSVMGEEGKPTLSKLIQVSSLPKQYLSPLIVNFRPKTSKELNPLSQKYINQISLDWLQKVEKLLREKLTEILSLIDDIKRLHKIVKEEVFEVDYPENWKEMVNSLLDAKELNVYNEFIKDHVTNRIKELIQSTWQKNLNEIFILLNQVDEDALKDRGNQLENNIRWFVWKESKSDGQEDLKLKTLGFTPRVMELCGKMDSFLTGLLNDVKLYVGSDSTFKSESGYEKDGNLILPFLNGFSLEMIRRFSCHVRASCESGESEKSDSKIILRARFLISLATQSPGLEKCLRQGISLQEDFKEDSESATTWQQATALLADESAQIWRTWTILTSSKLKTLIRSKLGPTISLRNLLRSKLLSEIITIEEQTEDGTSVKSDLRVPSQPSLPLQELLFQICQQLNGVAPHTLPRQIHQELIDSAVKEILERYREWIKSDLIYQSQAWQMLLDVKFLTLLLITKENRESSREICEIIEKTIDPFDLDVYFPHLQNAVKKSAQKLQGTLGILINFTEKLPVFNGLKLTETKPPGSKLEEPNLMATSSGVPWFPPLPVAGSAGNRKRDSTRPEAAPGRDPSGAANESVPEGKVTGPGGREREKSKRESARSDFFKSAGAFFDAVTGGWS